MNILLLNQDWFAAEFRQAGHKVLSCGTATHLDIQVAMPMLHIDSVRRALPDQFEPDVIVWLDNSAPILFVGLEECDVPMVMYSVDTHHHLDLHAHISVCFDHVFVAQKDFIPSFPQHSTPVSWLPLWASRYVDASDEKRYPATFVGTMNRNLNPKRVEFFEALQNLTPVHIEHGRYWEIFPHADIVVNQTVKGDLNFRVFEALMCGSLLLTERTGNGLFDLFEDETHLVSYEPGNAHDAARLINELRADPVRMKSIAKAGRAEVLAKHTPAHRAAEVLRVLEGITKRAPSPLRYYSMLVNHNVVATLTESTDTGVSAKAAVAALAAGEQALKTGLQPGQFEAAHLIIATLRYDRLLRTGGGKELLFAFQDRFPSHQLLGLASVRTLLNEGKMNLAKDLAEKLSPQPVSTTFAAAEETVTALLDLSGPDIQEVFPASPRA